MVPDAVHPPRSRLGRLLAAAAASGCLLFTTDHPWHLWPLQAVALVPLVITLMRWCASARAAALAGAVLGVCYLVPMAVVLQFPLLLGGALALYLTSLWVVMAAALHVVLRWPAPLGPVAAGAVAVLVEWFDFSLVPVWGTAQSFVRVWTAAPEAIQIVSLTGVLGLVFVVVTGQTLLVGIALGRRRAASALVLLAMLAACGSWTAWRMTRPPLAHLRVAAVGWTAGDLAAARIRGPLAIHERLYLPLVREAAAAGARLVVSPEVGFVLNEMDRHDVMARAGELAQTGHLWLAFGYLDMQRHENRVAFIGPDGKVHGEYVKTHLIPFIERYPAGDGTLVTVDVDGVRVGAQICQDDNFTDLARAYGRRGVQVMAVPTNDWREVSPYHLENARFRPVENGHALVRAASNGTSAIISPRGKLLAARDHFLEGPGAIVADVALGAGGTPYSTVGDWLAGGAALILLATGAIVQRRRRRRAAVAITSATAPS